MWFTAQCFPPLLSLHPSKHRQIIWHPIWISVLGVHILGFGFDPILTFYSKIYSFHSLAISTLQTSCPSYPHMRVVHLCAWEESHLKPWGETQELCWNSIANSPCKAVGNAAKAGPEPASVEIKEQILKGRGGQREGKGLPQTNHRLKFCGAYEFI